MTRRQFITPLVVLDVPLTLQVAATLHAFALSTPWLLRAQPLPTKRHLGKHWHPHWNRWNRAARNLVWAK
jgi:hypothetical protein